MSDRLQALTEREKQTLRLLVRGHDAKSIARHLDLSVHTINERLRDARRKLAVPSSRAAARLLLEAERGTAVAPDLLGDTIIGGASRPQPASSGPSRANAFRRALWIGGTLLMTLTLAAIALATLAPPQAPPPPSSAANAAPAAESEAVAHARRWLALVDAHAWDASWAATAQSFRDLNTGQTWARVSEDVRVPLGEVTERLLADEQSLPAPPHGYQVVRFRTGFANRPQATEVLSLAREDGEWKVAGYIIE